MNMKTIRMWIQDRRDRRFLRQLERVLNNNPVHANITGSGAIDWDGAVCWRDSDALAATAKHIAETMPFHERHPVCQQPEIPLTDEEFDRLLKERRNQLPTNL